MIRLAKKEDAPQIASIYRPYCEDNCVSFETAAPDASEVAQRIEKVRKRLPWLVEDDGGAIAGYAYASPHREKAAYRWAVEVTIYVLERHHGRGVGRALYQELFRCLRDQGYFKAYAGIVIPNPPSQAFHEAMGFAQIATYENIGFKLGAWRTTGWWQLTLQTQTVSPPEPRPPLAQ